MKELFDLAYAFRNSKIWKTVFEEELFAVSLPDRRIGSCYMMGRNGEHMALAVHIGREGFSSYRKLKDRDPSAGSPMVFLYRIASSAASRRRTS